MSQDINKYILGESLIYSATYSPYRQGASLAFPWQMFAYTNLKIRGNEDFIFARDLIPQTQEFFDDSMSLKVGVRSPPPPNHSFFLSPLPVTNILVFICAAGT